MKRLILSLIISITASVSLPAQTASDLNQGLGLTFSSGSGTLSWWGTSNRVFFVQTTDDLLTPWEYCPVIELGSGVPVTWGFSSTSSSRFFRLKMVDMYLFDVFCEDLDGDSVSNMQELNQKTDPFSAVDADGNGLADDWEQFYLLTVASSDEESDLLDNRLESLIGTSPTKGHTASSQMSVFLPR